jgi:transcriptional regulator with XRE-family HTH domain
MSTKVPNPVDKDVGSRVRIRRRMLGMTQAELGDKLGLTFQQVQKYEKGVDRISASRLQALSRILHVPAQYFFDGSAQIAGYIEKNADTPSPAYFSGFLASPDGQRLVKAFTRMGHTELRRSLVRLVEEIAGESDG